MELNKFEIFKLIIIFIFTLGSWITYMVGLLSLSSFLLIPNTFLFNFFNVLLAFMSIQYEILVFGIPLILNFFIYSFLFYRKNKIKNIIGLVYLIFNIVIYVYVYLLIV